MKEKFLEAIEIFKQTTAKECCKIEYEDREVGILDDKLGGKPYLPLSEEYPLTSSGNPMGLLLQINLKNVNLEGYPNKGILEIFIDSQFDWPLEYKIMVFEEGLEYQTDLPVVESDDFPIRKPLAITCKKDICHMPISNYNFAETFCSIVNEICGLDVSDPFDIEDYVDFDWYDVFYENIKHHPITIGGYPDFTQSDPRDNELEGYDECLFKLDGGDYNYFWIGDAGIIFTLIQKKDLNVGDLQNAKVDWDCC